MINQVLVTLFEHMPTRDLLQIRVASTVTKETERCLKTQYMNLI